MKTFESTGGTILGVRELFEQEPPPPPRKTRAEMMKDIDADYYGYMDDDDGILIPLEQKAEKECKTSFFFRDFFVVNFSILAIQKAIDEWKSKKSQRKGSDAEEDEEEEDIYAVEVDVR